MTRVLVVALSDLGSDPRVDRQIEFLKDEFEVVAAGFGPPNQDVEFHPLIRTLPPPPVKPHEDQLLSVFDERERALSLGQKARLAGSRVLRGDWSFIKALVRFVPLAMLAVTAPLRHRISMPVRNRWQRLFPLRRALAPYPRSYWMDAMYGVWVRQLRDVPADVILVNDAVLLPAGLAIAGDRPVVFDAHEYAPAENAGDWRWRRTHGRMLTAICRREIPRVQSMMTVSPGLVDAYRSLTGVEAELVTNAPWFAELRPSPVHTPIRLVHWGGASPARRPETMIEVMDLLDDRFTLDLVFVTVSGQEPYIAQLRTLAEGNPRIRFVDPVPMPDLPRFGNQYDIGLYPLPALHTNQEFALPNKFFEFVQARLAVVIGPSPEMAHLTRQYGLGLVTTDITPESIADALRSLSDDDIADFKRHADAAARELSAERNAETVRRMVRTAATPDRASSRAGIA